jgi:excisionase family DNA binding protein
MKTLAPIRPLLTARDVCQLLQKGRTSLYRLLESAEIRAVKIGGSLRFEPAEIEKFINRNRRR